MPKTREGLYPRDAEQEGKWRAALRGLPRRRPNGLSDLTRGQKETGQPSCAIAERGCVASDVA